VISNKLFYNPTTLLTSGTGTNLKVGGTGEERKWGAPIRREAPEIFFWSFPSTASGSKSRISRFDERFRDGQYSLVSFLFAVFLLTVTPVPSHL